MLEVRSLTFRRDAEVMAAMAHTAHQGGTRSLPAQLCAVGPENTRIDRQLEGTDRQRERDLRSRGQLATKITHQRIPRPIRLGVDQVAPYPLGGRGDVFLRSNKRHVPTHTTSGKGLEGRTGIYPAIRIPPGA